MSKYDRNGVKHDGWADVGRANRGELNRDIDYQRRCKKLENVKEHLNQSLALFGLTMILMNKKAPPGVFYCL